MAKYDYHTCRATGEFEIYDDGERTPCVVVKCRIVSGPLAGEERNYRGYLSEKAAPYTFEALRALGWKCNDISKLEGLGDINAQMGLRMESHEGKTYERVGIWPLEKRVEGISAEQKNAFAAQFASLAASVAPVARGDFNAPSALPEKRETSTRPVAQEEDSPF